MTNSEDAESARLTELKSAAAELLFANIKDAGDPDEMEGDVGAVGWAEDPDTRVITETATTFAMITRLRNALRAFI